MFVCYFLLPLRCQTKTKKIMKNNKCNIKMTLISKGIKIEKICKNEFEVFQFERNMPDKYDLLFSNIPYVIGKINLNYFN